MALIQLDPAATTAWPHPLWRQAFRPFFLGGSLLSVLALGLWLSVLSGHLPGFQPHGGALWWHAHEMLFGFTSAIIAGFLLTAVQNWTGLPGLRGRGLAAVFGLWLAARLGLLLSVLPTTLVAALDLAFLPTVALVLGRDVIRVKLWRNLIFLPLLAALTLANALMHAAVLADWPAGQRLGAHGAVLLVVAVITVLGGRVIPFFTSRGLARPDVAPIPALEWLTLGSTLLIALLALTGLTTVLPLLTAVACFAAALGHGARQLRWQPFATRGVPLLWSLHAAYATLAPGFLLLGLAQFGLLAASTALHVFTVGAIGGLILAMMARVSLGHTGRPLTPPRALAWAFGLMSAAVLLRVAAPLLGVSSLWAGLGLSALAWLLAYGLFLRHFGPWLASPRVDGRLG